MFGKDKVLRPCRTGVDWIVRSHWRAFLIIFLLAFGTRYQRLSQIHPRHLVPTPAWELTSIAISLMETGEFANPYKIPTGPTAHLPPIYPFLISLIYRTFGLTTEAGLASGLFMITAGAVLYGLLPWFSEKLGLKRQAGFFGGLGGALMVEGSGHGEYLTGIVLGLTLVAFLQRWTSERIPWLKSLLLGLGIGTAFHLQPALLPVVVGCMAFELWQSRKPKKWGDLGILTLGILFACIPWAWRNYQVFNAVFFIRSNFGLELRMGNHEGAVATMEVMDAQGEHIHPRTHFPEARKLRDVGEIAYMRDARREALDWIRAHPGEFAWLSLLRVANLWLGPLHRLPEAWPVWGLTFLAFLGAWRTLPGLKVPQRAALLIPLTAYPFIYYFMAYMPRYRMPIDWLLLVLAGAAVRNWVWGRERPIP